MPLRVNNNIAAINAGRHLNANNRNLGVRLERLASGLRINRASDDAAGLSVREGLRAELSGLRVNVKNAEQATNLLQTAEGSLNEINSIMIRMHELATQSANTTVTNTNRVGIQAEYSALTAEIDRIAESTTYNTQVLLTGYGNTVDDASTAVAESNVSGVNNIRLSGAQSGTYTFVDDDATDSLITLGNGTVTQTIDVSTLLSGDSVASGTQIVANFDRLGINVTLAGDNVMLDADGNQIGAYTDALLDTQTIIVNESTGGKFQIGPTNTAANRIEVDIADMRATGAPLNIGSANVSSMTAAQGAMDTIRAAVTRVSEQRGEIGAVQNRLGFTIAYTQNEIENIQASEAAISDADIADEVSSFTRAQILSQAATAMLAQANVMPQNALALMQ